VPVERRKGARQLVQQLRELKSVEVLDSSHHSQKDEVKTPSPVRSQVEAVTSDGGSDEQDNHSALATQVGFVSQMPRNKKTTGMVSESTPVQSPRHRPNTGQIAPEHYIAAPAATKANRRTTTHPDKLLGLLTGAQDPKTLGPRTNQTMKASRTLGVSVSKTSPESVNEPEKAAQHSETGEDADFRQSETPVSFLKEKLTNGHAETTAGLQSGAIRNREANIHVPQEFLEGNEVSAEQSRSQKSVLSTGQEAEDAMKETSQGNMQGQIAQTDGEKGERISNEFRVERAEGKKVDQHAINDPWKVRCSIYPPAFQLLR